MNLDSMKAIVNNEKMDDSTKRDMIISVIAADKDAVPDILLLLNSERKRKNDLINDYNVELSRALVLLEDDNLKAGKKVIVDPKWVAGEIKKHFLKWKDYIKCNFKVKGLP